MHHLSALPAVGRLFLGPLSGLLGSVGAHLMEGISIRVNLNEFHTNLVSKIKMSLSAQAPLVCALSVTTLPCLWNLLRECS